MTIQRRPAHRLLPFLVILAVALAVVAAAGMVLARQEASAADVAASSASSGFGAASIEHQGRYWRSDRETIGAWLELRWGAARPLHSVSIRRPAGDRPNVDAGMLTFGDGSRIQVVFQPGQRTAAVSFSARQVTWVRFTATSVEDRAIDVSVDRFTVDDAPAAESDPAGDAVPTASISASDGTPTVGLRHGSEWKTESGAGTVLRFRWSRPRVLDAVVVTGSARSPSRVRAATIRFDDGTTVPVGAVGRDPSLPTTVAFLARSVRAVTITIDSVDGSGGLALDRVRLMEQGFAAAPLPADEAGVTVIPADAADCSAPPSGATDSLRVLCPGNGDRVGDRLRMTLALPGGAEAGIIDVWSATTATPALSERAPRSASGLAAADIDISALPDGPFTVRVAVAGSTSPDQVAYVQLMHGIATDRDAPPSAAARGRTLVYEDLFDGPRSIARDGTDSRYAASRPTSDGVADFGDAIFADPADGLGNVGVVDRRYLRLAVSPLPAGQIDPQGQGRTSVGGLVASAHSGGAGFSAQYGYFEARMLVQAAPGTWPAFWLLPNRDLVSPSREGAEFDAVELYGHDPTSACQTTHAYLDGVNVGGEAQCGQRFPTARDAAAWHTYGVDVSPTRIRFSIDGVEVASAPQVSAGGSPMYFLADLALGGGWPVDLHATSGRAQVLVDSIRVYV